MQIDFCTLFCLFYIVSAAPLLTFPSHAPQRVSLALPVPRLSVVAPTNLKGVEGGYTKRPIDKHSGILCTPHVVKRQNGPVQKAVLAAKDVVENGLNSKTLLTTYNGQPAVLKILHNDSEKREGEVRAEVRCLQVVHQFLGWGHNADNSIFYIVMRKMGEPFEIANQKANGSLTNILEKLAEEAFRRYKAMYGLRHTDIHYNNFVFHQTSSGKWQAELIDWADAELDESAETPIKIPCEGMAEIITIDHH